MPYSLPVSDDMMRKAGTTSMARVDSSPASTVCLCKVSKGVMEGVGDYQHFTAASGGGGVSSPARRCMR